MKVIDPLPECAWWNSMLWTYLSESSRHRFVFYLCKHKAFKSYLWHREGTLDIVRGKLCSVTTSFERHTWARYPTGAEQRVSSSAQFVQWIKGALIRGRCESVCPRNDRARKDRVPCSSRERISSRERSMTERHYKGVRTPEYEREQSMLDL